MDQLDNLKAVRLPRHAQAQILNDHFVIPE